MAVIKRGLVASILLTFMTCSAHAGMMDLPVHFGLMTGVATADPEPDYDKVLRGNWLYFGGMVGSRFHQYFGAEFGYRTSTNRTKRVSISDTSEFFGTSIATQVNSDSEVKKSSFDLDLNAFYPFNRYLEAVGVVGLSFSKLKTDVNVQEIGGTVDNSLRGIDSPSGTNFHFGVGVDYKFFCKWILSARGFWDSNKKLEDTWDTDGVSRRMYKDEFGISLALKFAPWSLW